MSSQPSQDRIVTDIASLIETVREVEEGFGRPAAWFRGQSDASWDLLPSSHRDDAVLESVRLAHFRMKAGTRHQRCPHASDHVGWLALARHYGLRTRLLDWTDSLAVAVFFAVEMERRDVDAAVWILNPAVLNHIETDQALIFQPEAEGVKTLALDAFQARQTQRAVVAIMIPHADARMAAQLSNYTIHGNRVPLNRHPEADQFVQKLTIPRASLARIRADLILLGIRRSILFPDLHNLAAELNDLQAITDSE